MIWRNTIFNQRPMSPNLRALAKDPRWYLQRGVGSLLMMVALGLSLGGCGLIETGFEGPSRVEILGQSGQYQMLRNGEVYRPVGAGSVPGQLESLKAHGANSIRTWHVGDGGILDDAHALGLTVSLCLDVGRERLGFDYDAADAVAEQLEEFRETVRKFKNHPALLTWIIGNELNIESKNPKVWNAVNDIALMIKAEDPNHPVTTALAGLGSKEVRALAQRAPALDFISAQVYGGISGLAQAMDRVGLDKPLMVTEWGTRGHWETRATQWRAPIELSSARKAEHYISGYNNVLEPNADRIIGSYAFLWGQKQERTPTWYGTLTASGHRTEAADALFFLWQGRWPENRAPQVSGLTLNGKRPESSLRVRPGQRLEAQVSMLDREADPLTLTWIVRPESQAKQVGGDLERVPPVVPGLLKVSEGDRARLSAPATSGAYRLFVRVEDTAGGVGHANFPFWVR